MASSSRGCHLDWSFLILNSNFTRGFPSFIASLVYCLIINIISERCLWQELRPRFGVSLDWTHQSGRAPFCKIIRKGGTNNQPRKTLNPPNNPGRLKSFSLSLPSLPLALQSWSATPGFSKFHLQLKTGFRTFSCKLQQIAIPTYWWSSTADPFFQITAVLNYNIEPRPLHQDQWYSLSPSCCQRVTLGHHLKTTGTTLHQFGTTLPLEDVLGTFGHYLCITWELHSYLIFVTNPTNMFV